MDFQLDKDIYANQIHYFFSLLGPRFDSVNTSMARSLEKKFGGIWKPISVYSAHPGKAFIKDNFIVLNNRASGIEKTLKEHVIYLQEYEDLNREFQHSHLVQEIIENLLHKQKSIFVYPFTTAFLEETDAHFSIIGPDPKIATYFDEKIHQYLLFQELNLPRIHAQIFESSDELLNKIDSILPCYISASYSSGGNESGFIYSKEMLQIFLGRLRTINAVGRFLVAGTFKSKAL